MCLSSWHKLSLALILLELSVPSPSPLLLPGFAKMPATPAGPDSTVPPIALSPLNGQSTDTHSHARTRAHSAAPECRVGAGQGLMGGLGLGLHISKGGLAPPGATFLQPGLWLVALTAFVTPTQGPRFAHCPLSRTPGFGTLLPRPMGSALHPAPPTPQLGLRWEVSLLREQGDSGCFLGSP